ncbi:hypothetical protein SNEBB_009050 [Seison nebaliae]|nr:hypothetical protein SNEBB_009050 [Seison nebaliae]
MKLLKYFFKIKISIMKSFDDGDDDDNLMSMPDSYFSSNVDVFPMECDMNDALLNDDIFAQYTDQMQTSTTNSVLAYEPFPMSHEMVNREEEEFEEENLEENNMEEMKNVKKSPKEEKRSNLLKEKNKSKPKKLSDDDFQVQKLLQIVQGRREQQRKRTIDMTGNRMRKEIKLENFQRNESIDYSDGYSRTQTKLHQHDQLSVIISFLTHCMCDFFKSTSFSDQTTKLILKEFDSFLTFSTMSTLNRLELFAHYENEKLKIDEEINEELFKLAKNMKQFVKVQILQRKISQPIEEFLAERKPKSPNMTIINHPDPTSSMNCCNYGKVDLDCENVLNDTIERVCQHIIESQETI